VAAQDKTDTANVVLNYCKGVVAGSEEMAALWSAFLDDKNSDSLKIQNAQMSGFESNVNEEEVAKYKPKFFAVILGVFEHRVKEFAKHYYDSLFPAQDDLKELLDQVNLLIPQTKADDKTLVKQLNETKDDLERRIKCRNCLDKYLG